MNTVETHSSKGFLLGWIEEEAVVPTFLLLLASMLLNTHAQKSLKEEEHCS
jgi:hypothetical protein